MKPSVNLLPLSYRRAQTRRRRVRLGIALGGVLLSAELFSGLLLDARAERTRELVEASKTARSATASVRQRMEGPARESSLLAQQLALARKLRTTHSWSRLLGVFAQAASSHVFLTSISTEPARWSPALEPHVRAGTSAKTGQVTPGLLQGLTVSGYAGDYEELSKFVKGLQEIKAFASLSLKEARKDKYLDQEVVSFDLQCHW